MSDQRRKVGTGLMRALGSDLWWGVALATLAGDRSTGEWVLIFPFLSGEMVISAHRVCQWCDQVHDPSEGCQRTAADMRRLRGEHGTGSPSVN